MVCLNRRALSSAIVVILLAAAGIVIATIAIKFLHGAALDVEQAAGSKLKDSLELLNTL